jgi:hypothetical protein
MLHSCNVSTIYNHKWYPDVGFCTRTLIIINSSIKNLLAKFVILLTQSAGSILPQNHRTTVTIVTTISAAAAAAAAAPTTTAPTETKRHPNKPPCLLILVAPPSPSAMQPEKPLANAKMPGLRQAKRQLLPPVANDFELGGI